MMRFFPFLFLLGACRPTSLLELDLFVGNDVLGLTEPPALVYIDYGPGHLGLAVSLCEWGDNEFRETTLEPVEYEACPDTLAITAVLAPFPEGSSCNEGDVLFLGLPPEDTWIASTTIDVFATEDCSIIESHTLRIAAAE